TVKPVVNVNETIQFKVDRLEITYTVDMFCATLKLPLETPENPFISPETIKFIQPFLKIVGYQGDADKVSVFFTKNLAQAWQTMFKVFNRCLTSRTSGHDQTKINILQIFHVVVNRVNVDYADLLWWVFLHCVQQKKDMIQYLHFTKLIIADLMEKFDSIPKRLEEDYQSIKDDISLVSVYTTGMLIPDEFLIDDIYATEEYKEYVKVFVKVDFPTLQSQPVESAQGMNRTLMTSNNISKKARILELKRIHLKINVLTSNTLYPSRKIRRICACTSQKTTKETRSIRRLRKKYRLNLKNDMPPRDKMDNPNITMEEYIRLEEEKALRNVFNDELSSEKTLSCEPTVSSLNNNEINFRISFDESDDEDYTYTNADIANFEMRLAKIYRRKSVFTSRAWRRIFEIRVPLVHELILEFFSTFRFGEGVLDLDTARALQFQLGGARRRMSWRQFIFALGLHTAEEMETAGFGLYYVESGRQISNNGDLSAY
ncbi:hypothetical protein Tco_1076426, partial [Tanacetum coccineum]